MTRVTCTRVVIINKSSQLGGGGGGGKRKGERDAGWVDGAQ